MVTRAERISSSRSTGEETAALTPSMAISSMKGVGRFTKSVIPGLIWPKMPATYSPVFTGSASRPQGR